MIAIISCSVSTPMGRSIFVHQALNVHVYWGRHRLERLPISNIEGEKQSRTVDLKDEEREHEAVDSKVAIFTKKRRIDGKANISFKLVPLGTSVANSRKRWEEPN